MNFLQQDKETKQLQKKVVLIDEYLYTYTRTDPVPSARLLKDLFYHLKKSNLYVPRRVFYFERETNRVYSHYRKENCLVYSLEKFLNKEVIKKDRLLVFVFLKAHLCMGTGISNNVYRILITLLDKMSWYEVGIVKGLSGILGHQLRKIEKGKKSKNK